MILVEDNYQVSEAICEQIESLGFNTIAVESAETALEKLIHEAENMSLILTDVSLSGPYKWS